MMKRIFTGIILLGLSFTVACRNNESTNTKNEKTDTSFAIIGKVTGSDTGMIYLYHRQPGIIDSMSLDHGFFKFNGKADTAEMCTIIFNGQSKKFFLENGKISMLIKKDSLHSALISGTEVLDNYNYFQNQTCKSLNQRMSVLDSAYGIAINTKNQGAIDSLEKKYNALDLEQKQLVIEFAKAHPASIAAAYEIYTNFSYNPRLGQIDSLYRQLDSPVRITYFGKQIATIIEKTKLTAIGKPAPEFSCNDADGNPVLLSSFKGSYVLLDFWASWCGPCRRENPSVVKAYHQFRKKGFDIFGVSLDLDKEKWLKAIKKDGLDWTQVSELKGWQGDIISLYGINGIPMNYLLDKNGIIIAKGLNGDELNSKLAEILH